VRSHPADNLERHWAAELVRTARRAARRDDVERASELLDWALLLVPESPAVERLRIELLLRENQHDAAAAMIERRLLRRPNDIPLLLLRAKCRALRGELPRADEDLCRVRMMAPKRRDAMELAAEVASRLGEHVRAVDLLARLLARNPDDERTLELLSCALIESGEREKALHAERLLLRLDDPPPALLARSYLVQGRSREAMDCIEAHINAPQHQLPDEQTDSLLALYAEALESCGEVSRIDALMNRILTKTGGDTPRRPAGESACADSTVVYPRTALALARIILAQGRFRAAAGLSLGVARTADAAHRRTALPIAVVAATLAGRKRLARRIMSHFTSSPTRPLTGSPLWVDCWRRGLRGRILHEQRCAIGAAAGGDPSPSVLRPLLRNAVDRFQHRRCEHQSNDDGPVQIEQDLAICHAALGTRR
jgi:tetratricopeptide (TPR) repeat protein